MPKHTIVAQFNDYGAAHRAYCELLQTGIQPDDMSLIAGDHANREGATRDFGILADDADFYLAAVRYRLRRTGLRLRRLEKVHLSWEQFGCAADLSRYPPPWDWFFEASGR